MSSPTQRSKATLEKDGWTTQIVERWNPFAHVRQDVYGFGDILAMSPTRGIMLVQTTSRSNMNARITKIRNEPKHAIWLASGGLIVVHGWSKKGARGKRKVWTLDTVKIEAVKPTAITLLDIDERTIHHTCKKCKVPVVAGNELCQECFTSAILWQVKANELI